MSRPGTVVIVGTGQGGFQTAASLREGGFDGRVVLVGDEPDLPYQRPPLSKAYLTGKADAALVRLRPERFYADRRLELRAGERAAAIDRAGRQVVLTSGERLPYDHLVLATGAHNRALPVPGGELDGVFQLRSLAEAEALRRRLDGARRAVVVGAGFIGLEFAAVAAERGLEVTVVEAADRVMARAVSPADLRALPGGPRAARRPLRPGRRRRGNPRRRRSRHRRGDRRRHGASPPTSCWSASAWCPTRGSRPRPGSPSPTASWWTSIC